MRKTITATLICACLISSCAIQPTSPEPATQQTSNEVQIIRNSSKATLTPFQPMPPTETSGPTNTPLPTATFTPQPTPTLASAVHLGLPKPEGQVNILILGSDYRPGQGYLTDTIMVLSVNPVKGTASLVSFPRDLYVMIPGVGMSRINAAHPYGGFALTAATLEINFDIKVDYYIMTSFSGFKNIINTLGGINVSVGSDLYDTCDLPQAVEKHCYVATGVNVMDGETALWYVRSRSSTSDFDRTRRAQEVMTAIFQKTMGLNAVNRGSELYQLFVSSVETNLPLDTVLSLLPFAAKLTSDPALVKRYSISPSNVTNYIVPSTGAMVLIPDPVSIGEIIRQAFYQ